ncbi:MAG: hypothetical protein PF447_14225 [Spirochaetaceae bacterium]|jgi:transposase-like protein|nr:hypothetical protein [Spirochaetaceae bacterium]
MHRIPHCPNPLCPSNKAESEIKPSFRKKGFESNKRQEKIQRYQCKNCRQTFNINVFDINYYAHKSIDYKRLVDAMISSSGIRDMARQFRCSPSLIQNRIDRLARKAMALFAKLSETLELKEDVAADGLESFVLSQFFPTNINILVGSKSQFIYYFNSFFFHRKGRTTKAQKEKAKELYQRATFEKGAPSRSFKELLDYLAALLDRSYMTDIILDTDKNQIYHHQFVRHPKMEKVIHRKTDSKEERNTSNKLFPCNYIDRQIRKDQAEHVRETLQFSRNISNSMNRFFVYSFWHNFMKPFRINRKKSNLSSHGEAAGIDPIIIGKIKEDLFDGTRSLYFSVKNSLNPFQQDLWEKRLLNPLHCKAV